MAERLFRDQAVRARYDQHSSVGSNVPPPSHWLIAVVVTLIIAAIAAILFLGTYTASDTVRGYITPSEGSVRVFAPRTGTVAELFVRDGDDVSNGEPLLSVSAERLASGVSVDTQVIKGIEAELSVVAGQLERAKELHHEQSGALVQQLQAALREQELLRRQLTVSDSGLSLLQEDLARAEKLNTRGFLSGSELQGQRLAYLAKQQHRTELARESGRLQALINARRAERRELPLRHQDRVAELQGGYLRLSRERANVQALAAFTLTAPTSGIVSGLTVTRGATVTSAVPLMTLLPVPARYCAVLLIPSRTAGFIAPGDAVQLRIDAYPYQKFGVVGGTVSAVSKTVVLPGEFVAPVPLSEPSYRVRVDLDVQALVSRAGELPLRTGMTLVADVFRDRRRLIEWVLEPVIGTARRM